MDLHQRGMIEVRGITKARGGLVVKTRQLSSAPRPPVVLQGMRAKYVTPHDAPARIFVHGEMAGCVLDMDATPDEPETDLRFEAELLREQWEVSWWDPSAPAKTCHVYDAEWLLHVGSKVDSGWVWECFLYVAATGVEVMIESRQIALDLD